jgi:hypothetical protein
MSADVTSLDLVVLRQIVAGAHQVDVLGYERRTPARVRDDVVEGQVVGTSAVHTFALVALPRGKLHIRWDESVLL